MLPFSSARDNGEGSSHSPSALSTETHSTNTGDVDDQVNAQNQDDTLLEDDFLSEDAESRFVLSIFHTECCAY